MSRAKANTTVIVIYFCIGCRTEDSGPAVIPLMIHLVGSFDANDADSLWKIRSRSLGTL